MPQQPTRELPEKIDACLDYITRLKNKKRRQVTYRLPSFL
jgi:hypothetical protein